MIDDKDVFRAAKLLIDRHGLKGASEHCAERIRTLREEGDLDGTIAWIVRL